MVSIGTVFTIGIIGAVAAAGYAVYRNADAIGAALSRGVEGYFTNPLGKWADDLFRNLSTGPGVSTNGETTAVPPPPGPGETGAGYWEGFEGSEQGPKLADDKNLVQTAFDIWYNEHFGPKKKTEPPIVITDVTPSGPIPQSPIPSAAGYYYADYRTDPDVPHIKDLQWQLTEGMADKLRETIVPGGFLKGIHYLGQSKLTEPGFKLFGKSQNYL